MRDPGRLIIAASALLAGLLAFAAVVMASNHFAA
jgi:hypothetical protein